MNTKIEILSFKHEHKLNFILFQEFIDTQFIFTLKINCSW